MPLPIAFLLMASIWLSACGTNASAVSGWWVDNGEEYDTGRVTSPKVGG
jgi:hypothetical protein